jgi:signal transduction histidine kinase
VDDTALPWRVPVSLLVLALTVAALSWWAVRRVTRPLADLARAADGLGQDLAQAPLPETGPEEVARANRAFNRMQQRLRRTLEGRTRMLAAVSHDLKTPLTRMRLRAEMLDDEDLRARMEHDLDEMSQMVGDALDHLRGLEQAQERRPVDVMALLESLQADQQAMGRDVQLEGACERPWLGGAAALRRCVNNLVDNAVLYGQRALLSVQDSPEALTIRVRDAGPGLPPEALEQVFEPFFRLEASRNRVTGGSGLGLTIARQIAEGPVAAWPAQPPRGRAGGHAAAAALSGGRRGTQSRRTGRWLLMASMPMPPPLLTWR